MLQAPGLVTCFDDVAVMGETVQQRSRHLCVAKDATPFTEAKIGLDDDAGVLVEFEQQMEQQRTTGLRVISPKSRWKLGALPDWLSYRVLV